MLRSAPTWQRTATRMLTPWRVPGWRGWDSRSERLSGPGALAQSRFGRPTRARPVADKPNPLLLYETLAGLGAQEVERMLKLIRQLAATNITIAIIEHTMHAMVRLADRFIVLDHGAVLAQGTPDAVTREPSVIEAYLGKKWSARANA